MLADILKLAAPSEPWHLRLTGNSMSPSIVDGDELLVDPRLRARLGDVAVFPHAGKLVAHRIIETGAVLTTAGDASRGQTEHIKREDVVGIVTEIRRNGALIRRGGRSVGQALYLRARLALRYYSRLTR